jgi:hypothetical protein
MPSDVAVGAKREVGSGGNKAQCVGDGTEPANKTDSRAPGEVPVAERSVSKSAGELGDGERVRGERGDGSGLRGTRTRIEGEARVLPSNAER